MPEALDEAHLNDLSLAKIIIVSEGLRKLWRFVGVQPSLPLYPTPKRLFLLRRTLFFFIKTLDGKPVRRGLFGRVVVSFSEGVVRCDCTYDHPNAGVSTKAFVCGTLSNMMTVC